MSTSGECHENVAGSMLSVYVARFFLPTHANRFSSVPNTANTVALMAMIRTSTKSSTKASTKSSTRTLLVSVALFTTLLACVAWAVCCLFHGRVRTAAHTVAPGPTHAQADLPLLVGNPTRARPGAPTMRPFELAVVDAERERDNRCLRTGACE